MSLNWHIFSLLHQLEGGVIKDNCHNRGFGHTLMVRVANYESVTSLSSMMNYQYFRGSGITIRGGLGRLSPPQKYLRVWVPHPQTELTQHSALPKRIETDERPGLPNLNFQMGLMRLWMGYNWGTFLFIMGYLIGVHNLSAEIEGFLGKFSQVKLSMEKRTL
jgi:hypothetical protein